MSKQQRTINFRKWADPLSPLTKVYSPADDEEDHDLRLAAESFGFDDEPSDKPIVSGESVGPCIIGPAGIIPIRESNLPGTLYNFWVGDCNFDLTEAVVRTLERVVGVETLDIYSRYRFRVSIGRAFNEREVKVALRQAVQVPMVALPPPIEVESATTLSARLAHIKRLLARRFSHWGIFVMPDGKYEFAGGDSVEEVNSKSAQYTGVAKTTILSWEK